MKPAGKRHKAYNVVYQAMAQPSESTFLQPLTQNNGTYSYKYKCVCLKILIYMVNTGWNVGQENIIMALYKIVSIKTLQNWQIDQISKKPFARTPYTPL